MFSATVRVPMGLQNQVQLIKDAFQQSLRMADGWQNTSVMFPKTKGQRKRGAMVAICCQFAQEKFGGGVKENVVMKYNPTRVMIVRGTGDMAAININRDSTRAKVTYEAADSVKKQPHVLQTELVTRLE